MNFISCRRRVSKLADHGLTATATHDTKRGEDARARILALSEIPEDWAAAVRHWRELNKPLRDGPAPTSAHEYMLYQALIGAWEGNPDQHFVERMKAYALKAAREGKQQTSWTNPDEAYEKALTAFVEALLDPGRSSLFCNRSAISPSERRCWERLTACLNSPSRLCCREFPIFTRAPSYGISPWSIPTIGGRSILHFGKTQ